MWRFPSGATNRPVLYACGHCYILWWRFLLFPYSLQLSHFRAGGGSAQGAPEASTDGEEDAGEVFGFEDSEEEEEGTRLVVSNARTELGTREALQDPPPRRRSSISDDLEPLDEWEAEEALLEGRALVGQADSSTSLGKSCWSQLCRAHLCIRLPWLPAGWKAGALFPFYAQHLVLSGRLPLRREAQSWLRDVC